MGSPACGRSTGWSEEEIGHRAERRSVLFDIIAKRLDPARGLDSGHLILPGLARHDLLCRRYGASERVGEGAIDLARSSQMIEGCMLVESMHLDRPFDRDSCAAQHEPAVGLARDRHHAAIDLGGKRSVYPQLRLAGLPAPVPRRVIQKWKADRSLDLESPLPGKENYGGMGVDALDCLAAVGCRVGKERKHRLLAVSHARRGSS
jgi:hypothetical protein